MTRFALALAIACTACGGNALYGAPRPGVTGGSPVDAAAAGVVTADQVAHAETTETAYGWHLEVVGDQAKYFICSSADACSFRSIEIKASSVIGSQVVNRTAPVHADGTSGDEADVLKLTLARDWATTRGGITSDGRGMFIR